MKIKLLGLSLLVALSACNEDITEITTPEPTQPEIEPKTSYTPAEAIELGLPIVGQDYFTNPISEKKDTVITINSSNEEILLKFDSMASLITCWFDGNSGSYPCGKYNVAKCTDKDYWIFQPYETTGITHLTICQKDPYTAIIKTRNIGYYNICYTLTFGRAYGLLYFDPRGFPKYTVTIQKSITTNE